MTPELKQSIVQGAYWWRPPAEGAELAIAYAGALAGDAASAVGRILDLAPAAGLLAVTSADRLNAGWQAAQRARQQGVDIPHAHIETLLRPLARGAQIVTVADGHPAALAWLGGVRGHCVQALGVEHFGQTGTIPDLYRAYRIDEDAIVEACLATLPKGRRRS
jgi:pyruvate dehydrogenase E1 component